MLKFVGSYGFADEIDGISTVGFSANPTGDAPYLIIQKSPAFDEQDIRLGHDKPNFQIGPNYVSQYGGLHSWNFTQTGVTFDFSATSELGKAVSAVHVEVSELNEDLLTKILTMLKRLLDH